MSLSPGLPVTVPASPRFAWLQIRVAAGGSGAPSRAPGAGFGPGEQASAVPLTEAVGLLGEAGRRGRLQGTLGRHRRPKITVRLLH
ncbi:hypothetical protein SKAU_G00390890 [Synaphobranchus kaupii]|uniref:Uncharacterized protein n=1 Tax=Synaphobranchus kaupii TaxID=118154 RepID=A0A9Q1IDK7_SYNKA|nr:hypothetical protein SKAU_G00390890 [Synaphobranchus kaupii]